MVVVLAIGSTVAAWTFRGQNDQIKQHLGELNDSHRQLLAANSDGQKKLFQAYYDRARAQRYTRHEGQRFRSLEALKEATRIGRELHLPPEAFEPLRDEAIACLALPDLEPTGQVLTRSSEAVSVQFDATLSRYALLLRDGTLSVRQVADEREIARFPVGGVGRSIHSSVPMAVIWPSRIPRNGPESSGTSNGTPSPWTFRLLVFE